MAKSADAVSLGRKGGLKSTEKQQLARRRNILKALAKQHPRSVRIRQELARLEANTLPLGYCQAPHELKNLTSDRSALIQEAHPKSISCKDWKEA